jgi:hypothetical protein
MGVPNGLNQPKNSHVIKYIGLTNFQDNKYDISRIMMKLTIFESMVDQRPYQHGMISMIDDNGLHINLPIVGQEWLEVSFKTRLDGGALGETEFVKRYKITQVLNLQKQKENNNHVMVMHFVSEGFWLSESNLFSKSYKQAVTSDIVTDIMKEGLGIDVEVEPTLYPRDWIVPNTTAVDFIQALANESTSKDNMSSDFRFYENLTGWHFKSMYTLGQAAFKQRLNANIDNVSEYDRLKADIASKDIHFDLSDKIAGGYQITIDEIDTMEKRAITSQIGYDDYVTAFPTMNPEKVYVGKIAPEYPKDMHYRVLPGSSVYSSNRNSEVNQRLKRIMARALHNSTQMTLKIPGNIDLQLGDTAYFDFQYHGTIDYTAAGKYLICQIKHEMTTEEYTMTLGIRKESNIKGEKIEG